MRIVRHGDGEFEVCTLLFYEVGGSFPGKSYSIGDCWSHYCTCSFLRIICSRVLYCVVFVDKYPRIILRTAGIREPCAYIYVCVSSYSKVDAVEQKDMVNSGMRGTKERNLRTEVGCRSTVPIIYPIIFKYTPSAGNL
jgi:hypothetical protein